jgi:hypothetical protein
MGGPYALDHNVAFYHLGRMKLSDEEHDTLFDDLRNMEAAGLAAMRENKD